MAASHEINFPLLALLRPDGESFDDNGHAAACLSVSPCWDESVPIDSDGRARGCRLPSRLSIGIPGFSRDVGEVIPSSVEATPKPSARPDGRPRLVEGILTDYEFDLPLPPEPFPTATPQSLGADHPNPGGPDELYHPN